jgi:hypothetical protein
VDGTANPGVLIFIGRQLRPDWVMAVEFVFGEHWLDVDCANSAVAANQSRLNRRYSISAPNRINARKAIGNDGGIWRMSF